MLELIERLIMAVEDLQNLVIFLIITIVVHLIISSSIPRKVKVRIIDD